MNTKTKAILLGILGALIIGVFIWLKIASNNRENELVKENQKYGNVNSIYDYDTFLSIVKIIDDFYDNVSNLNADYIMDIYTKEYLVNNGLNSSNIINSINEDNLIIERYLADNYYVCSGYNCYVYAELEGLKTNYNGSYYHKIDSEYILITIDLKNATYNITPLTKDKELIDYANNYSKETVTIENNSNNSYIKVVAEDKSIISYYLRYVKYLIIINSDKIKNYVTNYSEYNAIEYLNRLGNTLYSYTKTDSDSVTKYHGLLYDGSYFDLVNYSPMNFKITFD